MKGIYSSVLVAFDRKGKIHEKGLRQIVRHNVDKMKVHGLYVGGSAGENFMLSTNEKKEILAIVRDEAGPDIELIAQIGSQNLYEAKSLADYATHLGYPLLAAVTPFHYKLTFTELKYYYDSIIDETDNRLIIGSFPEGINTQTNLNDIKELFLNKKIIGIKFMSADLYGFERLRQALPDKILLAGWDEMTFPALMCKADGVVGVTFNIVGHKAIRLFTAVEEGNFDAACDLQTEIYELIEVLMDNGLYQSLKLILQEQGVEAGYCRKPLREPSLLMMERARAIYKEFITGS